MLSQLSVCLPNVAKETKTPKLTNLYIGSNATAFSSAAWKTILDHLKMSGRCLGPKNVKNFIEVFWAFSGQK